MLVEKLNKDIIEAQKKHDSFRLTVLRMLKGAMQQEQLDNKSIIDDELLLACVLKQIKIRKESIETFKCAKRDDLIKQNEAELVILEEFLPEQLSDDEIQLEVEKEILKQGASSIKDMGQVMKELQSNLSAKADMKKVSSIVKTKLS